MTDWQQRAACTHPSVQPGDFTPPRNSKNQPDLAAAARTANAICRGCPVRVDCLDHASVINAQDIVQGGFYWPATPYRTTTPQPINLLAVADEATTEGVAA